MSDRLSTPCAGSGAMPAVFRMRADPPRHDLFPKMRSDFDPAALPAPMYREMRLLTHEMLGVGYATGASLAALQHGPLMPDATTMERLSRSEVFPEMTGIDLFAPRLRQALASRGLTFADLAAFCDRAVKSVKVWGVQTPPPPAMISKCAILLGVSEAWLCGETPESARGREAPSQDFQATQKSGAGNLREASPHVRPAPESARDGATAARTLSSQGEAQDAAESNKPPSQDFQAGK